MINKSKESWLQDAKAQKKAIFFFQDRVLDLTKFQNIHPGGKKALSNYIYKDITETVFSVYPHPKEHTTRVLLSYAIGKIPTDETKKNIKIERSITPTKEKKKVCFNKSGQGNKEKTEIIGLMGNNLTEDSWLDPPKSSKSTKSKYPSYSEPKVKSAPR